MRVIRISERLATGVAVLVVLALLFVSIFAGSLQIQTNRLQRELVELRRETEQLELQIESQRQLLEATQELLEEVTNLREENEQLRRQMEDWLDTWELSDISDTGNLTGAQRDFVNMVAPGALDSYQQHGILPSVTIAQAILESGWGRSGLSTRQNNLFGIKGTSRSGSVSLRTTEYSNGRWITVSSSFRAYDSHAQSVRDHGNLLANNSRYASVIMAETYHEAAWALQRAGYATDPQYANKLIRLVERYDLHEFDCLTGKVIQYQDKLILASRGGEHNGPRRGETGSVTAL